MSIKTEQNLLATTSNIIHPACIVCGAANKKGLHLQFRIAKDKSVRAIFDCNKEFEGYSGILHGGVISTVLDGAMGHCLFAKGVSAVTVEMTTRFMNPVLVGVEAVISARITRSSPPLYLLEAEIKQNGKIKARAQSKFYNKPELKTVCE